MNAPRRRFEACFKFTDLDGAPLVMPNTFRRERAGPVDRIAAAPAGACLPLVRAMAAHIGEPQYMLLVLHVSRREAPPGRYLGPLLSAADVDSFLHEFGEFLDRDGRQSLWIGNPAPDQRALIVWDRHQVVYGYGPLDAFDAAARGLGLVPGEVDCPVPHTHQFHQLFDDTEEEILARYDWERTPLREEDE